MRSMNTYFSNETALKAFIQSHTILDSASLLIQVFTSSNSNNYIKKLSVMLVGLFPHATLIGSTTDGEIMEGKVSTEKTVLNFTHFEHTTLKSASIKHQKDAFFSGEYLAQTLISKDTKLLLAFADGLHTNGDGFLEGINSIDSSVIVAGGLAGANGSFRKTHVFTHNTILSNGAVAVAFDSHQLTIHNDYSFDWQSIGKELTITKVNDNRVYKIDDKMAIETYVHYLGKETVEGLPALGIDFPLICNRNEIAFARTVISQYDDGSLCFSGNFQKGDKVRFGYGDPIKILNSSKSIALNMMGKPSETIFIYSCMARRHFMPDLIENEILPLQKIAPTAGFFTYGEFFTSTKKELLNQSMTILSLSESETFPKVKHLRTFQGNESTSHRINTLIHLLNTTSYEAMEKETLKQAHSNFERLYENAPDGIILIEKSKIVECNQRTLELFDYPSKEKFMQSSLLDIFPRRQPDGSDTYQKINAEKEIFLQKGTHAFEILLRKEGGQTFWSEIIATKTLFNNQEIIYLVCRDITERKEMEITLKEQKNRLYYQAHHDTLTGLPNRAFMIDSVTTNLQKSEKYKQTLAILFIDLDRFKAINDSFGHSVGDSVIILAGKRIKQSIRKQDSVARLGGDEFLVMMQDIEIDNILAIAKRILKSIDIPMTIEQKRLHTTASIGISCYPHDSAIEAKLLQYADTAMYKAKAKGGNRFEFYSLEY